jgi:hypothetical protein
MFNVSHRPCFTYMLVLIFIIVTFVQILKIPMILLIGHSMHIPQATLLANSSSPIPVPQNGTCSRVFVPVRPWRLAMFSATLRVVILRSFL